MDRNRRSYLHIKRKEIYLFKLMYSKKIGFNEGSKNRVLAFEDKALAAAEYYRSVGWCPCS